MKTFFKIALSLGAIYGLYKIFTPKQYFKLYVDNTSDTGMPYVCYNSPQGSNCTSINMPTNEFTKTGDIGISYSYKAELNAERNKIKITLFDCAGNLMDVITTKYGK